MPLEIDPDWLLAWKARSAGGLEGEGEGGPNLNLSTNRWSSLVLVKPFQDGRKMKGEKEEKKKERRIQPVLDYSYCLLLLPAACVLAAAGCFIVFFFFFSLLFSSFFFFFFFFFVFSPSFLSQSSLTNVQGNPKVSLFSPFLLLPWPPSPLSFFSLLFLFFSFLLSFLFFIFFFFLKNGDVRKKKRKKKKKEKNRLQK